MPTHSLSRRSFLALSAMLPWSLRAFAGDIGSSGSRTVFRAQRDEERSPGHGARRRPDGISGRRILRSLFRLDRGSNPADEEDCWTIWAFAATPPTTAAPTSRAENLKKARDMNLILGSKYVIMSSSQPKPGLEGWKEVADSLNSAADQLEPAGLKTGYHNHEREFTPVEGKRPIEILAKNTKPSVALQLDVGTCLKAGSDPVAWIRANPGTNPSPFIARTGRRAQTRGTPFCSEKAPRTGRAFSPPPRASEGWNIIWSSRKAAGSPSSRRRRNAWRHSGASTRTKNSCSSPYYFGDLSSLGASFLGKERT